MGDEATKALNRRIKEDIYKNKFFVGSGIDVGAGSDCLEIHKNVFTNMISCRGWDIGDGNAQYLEGIPDNNYDFLHSSHCLEHMYDPHIALQNWVRVVKLGGHIVITIPDEDLYEQGIFPSTFNGDHKATFSIWKSHTWSPVSINVTDLIKVVPNCRPIRILFNDEHFEYNKINEERYDQTGGPAECSIEFILRKES